MMQFSFTDRFSRELEAFSLQTKSKFQKQLSFLVHDIRHPSLRAKKYDEARDVWQMRIDRSIRCYFAIRGDEYVFLEIRKHAD